MPIWYGRLEKKRTDAEQRAARSGRGKGHVSTNGHIVAASLTPPEFRRTMERIGFRRETIPELYCVVARPLAGPSKVEHCQRDEGERRRRWLIQWIARSTCGELRNRQIEEDRRAGRHEISLSAFLANLPTHQKPNGEPATPAKSVRPDDRGWSYRADRSPPNRRNPVKKLRRSTMCQFWYPHLPHRRLRSALQRRFKRSHRCTARIARANSTKLGFRARSIVAACRKDGERRTWPQPMRLSAGTE